MRESDQNRDQHNEQFATLLVLQTHATRRTKNLSSGLGQLPCVVGGMTEDSSYGSSGMMTRTFTGWGLSKKDPTSSGQSWFNR